jgi:hypothetical protein
VEALHYLRHADTFITASTKTVRVKETLPVARPTAVKYCKYLTLKFWLISYCCKVLAVINETL